MRDGTIVKSSFEFNLVLLCGVDFRKIINKVLKSIWTKMSSLDVILILKHLNLNHVDLKKVP